MAAAATVYIAAVMAILAVALPARAATYPPGGPNDPGYAPVERGYPQSCSNEVVAEAEPHYLYSFEPKCTPNAHDHDGGGGMSVDKAWSTFTTGDPHTLIAYIEGGINWFDSRARDLADQVYLNTGELPPPRMPRATPTAPMTSTATERSTSRTTPTIRASMTPTTTATWTPKT